MGGFFLPSNKSGTSAVRPSASTKIDAVFTQLASQFDRRTGGGHVRQKLGDYDRAVGAGVTVVPLLVETFGGCAPPLMSALQRAADWRQNKLTSSEYDETTWSARTWLSFVSQRLSVATQLAAAQEVAEALGLSVAADPRLQ